MLSTAILSVVTTVPVAAAAADPGSPPVAAAGQEVCPDRAPAGASDGWDYKAEVTASEGLVLRDLRYGPRYVARMISIPYIKPKDFGTGEGHLTISPDGDDPDLRSTLTRIDCTAGDNHPGVSATYTVTSISEGLTFLVQQSYRLDPLDSNERCEATETAHCVRFWPTVTWALTGAAAPRPEVGLEVVQRFEFDPDAVGHGVADVIADVLSRQGKGIGTDDRGSDGRLKREDQITAIANGKTGHWENWHQTGRDSVGLPGLSAGCSECVHAHWSWFQDSRVRRIASLTSPGWTDGRPEILDGSRQTARAGWVKWNADEQQPADWTRLIDKNGDAAKLSTSDRPVFYWDAATSAKGSPSAGVSINGADYAVGDSYWPQLDNKIHGGNGSMFLVPSRSIPGATIEPMYQTAAKPYSAVPLGRLPSGYVLPVRISLGNVPPPSVFPSDSAGPRDRGPFYLRVHSTNAHLLNADSTYSPASTATPWVRINDDTVSCGPDGFPGPTTPVTCTWRLGNGQLLTYDASRQEMDARLVFDRPPTAADTSFELTAAPNGV